MNQYIQDMYKSLIEVFNAYEIKDNSLKEELEKWKNDFKDFAENFDDPVAFNTEYWGSELNAKHSNLINKIATASLGYSTEKTTTGQKTTKTKETTTSQETSKTEEEPRILTIKEFVKQYKASYNEVKKAGYRKNGELAYENLFNVAKRTNDILEGQIIIEKERLLWKIVKEDSLDIFKPILEAMDPLFHSIYNPLSQHIEIYEKAESENELNYYLEINKPKKIKDVEEHIIKMLLILIIQLYILRYVVVKENLYRKLDKKSKNAIKKLIIERNALKRAVELLKGFNLTVDDLFNDESLKIWLIFNQTIDLFGRFKYVNNPKNYQAIYEILTEEIIPDIPIDEILLKPPKNVFYHSLKYLKEEKSCEEENYLNNAKEKVDKLNSKLTYYKYLDKLESEAKNQVDLSIIDDINKK